MPGMHKPHRKINRPSLILLFTLFCISFCVKATTSPTFLPIQSMEQFNAEAQQAKTAEPGLKVEMLGRLAVAAARFAPDQQQSLLDQAVAAAQTITGEPQKSIAQTHLALAYLNLKAPERSDEYASKVMASIASVDVFFPTELYLKLSSYYARRGLYDRAERLGLRCLEEAKYDTDPTDRGRCYNQLAKMALILKQPDKALPYLDKAHSIFLSNGPRIFYATVLSNYAVTYNMLEQYETSLTYNMRALDINEKLGNFQDVVKNLNNIAATFYYLEQFEKAEEYFERVVNLAEKLDSFDTYTLSTSFMNLGEIRQLTNKKDQAEEALQRAVAYAEQSGNPFLEARTLAHLGALQLELGKLDLAQTTLLNAHHLAKKVNKAALLIRTHLSLGKMFNAYGDIEQAENHLNQALALTQDNNMREERYEVMLEMAYHHKAARNFELAFDLLLDYTEARTKQYQENMKSKVAEFQSKFEIHEKEKEISQLKNEQALQKLASEKNAEIRGWLIAFLALLLVFIIVILNRYRVSIEAKKIIEAKNDALENAQELLRLQARTDPLTKTKNRRAIVEDLQQLVDLSLKGETTFCTVLMDIDHFKQFNDTYGHDCGDFVLVQVAKLLTEASRDTDLLARWGGEEFLLVLPDLSLKEAISCADKIRNTIAQTQFTFTPENGVAIPLAITMTMGVADYQPQEHDIQSLIKVADERLYAGKAAGRNCVVGH